MQLCTAQCCAVLCCAVCSARERAVWLKMAREAGSMASKACYAALLLRDRWGPWWNGVGMPPLLESFQKAPP
jgi:hypothetical protein